jgi:glycosyltransferase involved in cell wall biosynthesis
MKICFIAEHYCFNGGGERILTLLCNELIKYYDITILSLLQENNESIYSINKKVNFKFANIKKIFRNGLSRLLCEIVYLKNNYSYLAEFDTIIGLGIFPNILLGIFYKKIKNVKKIGWVHNSYIGESSFIYKSLRYLFYRNLDSIIILTNSDVNNFVKINKNTSVINNFIVKRNKKISNPYKNKRFIFVGRIERKQKGIDYLCKILKLYYKTSDNPWECKIIGNGSYKKKLLSFIKRNNLDKYIKYLEKTSEIEKEYKQASCLLLTSRFEGFPMVLLEAISFGLPIISFDCPTGPAEVIKNNMNGFLIKQYSVNDFVDKMIEVENNEEEVKKMSVNAYSVSDKYMIDIIISRWLNILKI